MASSLSGYRRSRPLRLVFDGAYNDVDSSTIQAYLPKLWRHHGREIAHARFLSLDDYYPHRRRIHPYAIHLLGQYLCEVDRKPAVSAALSTGLEEVRSMSTYRVCDARSLTGEVFVSLGLLFDPKHFGCNARIFSELESFFQRHCSGIFQEAPDYWMRHLQALDRMSLNLIRKNPTIMASILSSVVYETRLRSRDRRLLFQAWNLSERTQHILATLVSKDEQRPSFKHGQCLHLACGSTMGPRSPRSVSSNNLLLRGGELLAPYGPHAVTVGPFRPSIDGFFPGEDFSDDECSFEDDRSLFDQLLEDDHPCARDFDQFMYSPRFGPSGSFGYFP